MDLECKITVTGKDGTSVEISTKAASRSTILKNIIENYPDEPHADLKDIDGEILKKVKEYLDHYENTEPQKIEIPLKSGNFKECVEEWDYNFLGEDFDIIFELVKAGNFMDIKPLQDLASAKIGATIRNITTETIRAEFDIKGKISPQEEEQIMIDKNYLEENI